MTSQTREYRDMLTTRGLQRLSCAVLATAVAHYSLWHSGYGKRVRRAAQRVERTAAGRVRPGEWSRIGLPYKAGSGLTRILEVCEGPDPGEFLTSPSVFHHYAGVDPSQFQRLLDDPKRLRVAVAALKTKPPAPTKARGASPTEAV